MIEENIINWIDLGDAKQPLDIYGEKKKAGFFTFLKNIKKNEEINDYLIILLHILFFLQHMTLNILNLEENNNDYILYIFQYLSKVFLLYDIIEDSFTYKLMITLFLCITIITIALLIYVIIISIKDIEENKIAIIVLNVLLLLEIYYFIAPVINIGLSSIICKNSKHVFLEEGCFSSKTHLTFSIISFIIILIHLALITGLSLYYTDIGKIGDGSILSRVDCNYEIYIAVIRIILFIGHFIIKNFLNNTKIITIIWEGIVLILTLFMTVFVLKYVFYFDTRIHLVINLGWTFSLWFSILTLLRKVLDLYDTTVFVILGWFIIAVCVITYDKIRIKYTITEFNVFEAKNLKDIEMFRCFMTRLSQTESMSNDTIIKGYINRYEEFLMSNPDLSSKYQKLVKDNYLKKKINNKVIISVYSIIYLIYSYHIEKTISIGSDLVVSMCYFLINCLKNSTYAIYLCSELKTKTHRQMYYKFLLMEEIKIYLLNKLKFSSSINSIRQVEISSVILYNIYGNLFKIKIYDATSNQIEYFDSFKNSVTTKKTTENFLKCGEEILSLRKQIMCIRDKLIDLNPFNSESEKDYSLYLRTILQDDNLAKQEEKKIATIKHKKIEDKYSISQKIYNEENSSVILIDGANDGNYKILYTTPNFFKMLLLSGKEMLNTSVNDLLPNVIQRYHKDFIEDATKYSNLDYIFKKTLDVLVKGKNNGLFNVNLFVKCVPNLSYGLNYLAYLEKIQDNSFIIVLDKDLKINGFTDLYGNMSNNENFIIGGNNFGLTQSVVGHHIGMVIPEILLGLKYSNEKNNFLITKPEMELKGNLYPINPWKEIEFKIESYLEKLKIKTKGNIAKNNNDLNNDINNKIISDINKYASNASFNVSFNMAEENKSIGKVSNNKAEKNEATINNTKQEEYDSIVSDIQKKYPTPISVFYKMCIRSFLRGTFSYYRVYIYNDLLKINQASIKEEGSNECSQVEEEEHFSDMYKKESTLGATFCDKSGERKITKKKHEIIFDAQKKIMKNAKPKKDKLEEEEKNGEENSQKNEENFLEKFNEENIDLNKQEINIKLEGDNDKKNKNKGSLVVLATTDETIYNRLKRNVMDNKESRIIYFMNLISVLYVVFVTGFIIYDSIVNLNNMDDLEIYLSENLIFNHSKISAGNLYISTLHLKFLKDSYITEDSCLVDNCTNKYLDNIFKSINDLKSQTENFSSLSQDFKDIVLKTSKLDLYSYNWTLSKGIELNTESIVHLIIYFGLKLKDGYITYLNSSTNDGDYDIVSTNLLEIVDTFLKSDISGFSGQKKTDKINENFDLFPVSLVIVIIVVIIYLGGCSYFIYLLYSYETYFLEKLINFNNPKFDAYLKSLDELKKKLRNDSEEEDDSKDDDMDLGNSTNAKNELENKKNKGKKEKEIEDKNNNDAKKSRRIKSKEKNKIQHAQKKKKTIMNEFFFLSNILFLVKILVLAILVFTYYIFSSLVDTQTKGDYLELEEITDTIEGIFKEATDKFLDFIREVRILEDKENTKRLAIINLSLGAVSNVTIEGKVYTKIEEIKNLSSYEMKLPNTDDLEFPKLGYLLMPLVSNMDNDIKVQINELFNGDSCKLSFNSNYKNELSICSNFWNGILSNGFEQAMTQMSVVISTVLDDLKNVGSKNQDYNLTTLLTKGSNYLDYSTFMEYYFYRSYLQSAELFKELRKKKVDSVDVKYKILLYCFIVVCALILVVGFIFISSIKKNFNSFLNFVAIFPQKFIKEDEKLYRETLNLENSIFHT